MNFWHWLGAMMAEQKSLFALLGVLTALAIQIGSEFLDG